MGEEGRGGWVFFSSKIFFHTDQEIQYVLILHGQFIIITIIFLSQTPQIHFFTFLLIIF